MVRPFPLQFVSRGIPPRSPPPRNRTVLNSFLLPPRREAIARKCAAATFQPKAPGSRAGSRAGSRLQTRLRHHLARLAAHRCASVELEARRSAVRALILRPERVSDRRAPLVHGMPDALLSDDKSDASGSSSAYSQPRTVTYAPSASASASTSTASARPGGGGSGFVGDGFAHENEVFFDEECAASDILGGSSDVDGEMTIMNDEDPDAFEEEEEVMEHSIEFHISRATVTHSAVIPCCIFIGRVRWGTTDWEIYFGQKQLLRLHINLWIYQLLHRGKMLRGVSLPWTIWREKRAEKRVGDVYVVQDYIRSLLKDRELRNSEPLLSFLEVSPSRAMLRFGPSLKEGYVHMRINGPFQLPLYTCFNRTIEAMYRHLYRTWMRIAFVSTIVGFIFPVVLVIITSLPTFFSPQKTLVSSSSGSPSVSTSLNTAGVFLGLASLAGIVFFIVFVYRFFHHRLGVIRRWVVLKPSCFAAYRNRSDREPSEVFLFDKTFTARKGSYRQGVSWMPSGFVVGSHAGNIEIDTGHYYTRFTALGALVVVCYCLMLLSSSVYEFQRLEFSSSDGIRMADVPSMSNWTEASEIQYCGYYFTVPEDGPTIHVESESSGVVISKLTTTTSNSSISASNLDLFWQSDDTGYSIGVITSVQTPGTAVSVIKKIDPNNDLFYPTGTVIDVPNVGNLTLEAVDGETLLQFTPVDYLCAIPVKISPVTWKTFVYYVLLLFTGAIIAPAAGLGVNYLVTYMGVWHPHVRRDHWYRCVRRLQKLKRQDTDHRFNSFAPPHVSTITEDDSETSAGSLAGARPSLDEGKHKITGSLHQMVNSAVNLAHKGAARIGIKSREDSSTQSEDSFATPPTPPCAVSWHVDGEDTYEAMYNAISNAKYEILIAGWWVCPDLFLLRPGRKLPPSEDSESEDTKSNETQLRSLLLKKAQAGVKIYVLIYREVKLALTLNSAYSKRTLMLHPNIRVLRDPIFQIQSLGFWSHHEKIVCIDQSLAFVGGLDLCFGRYDHHGHPLSDPGGGNGAKQIWRGKDYSNPIIKDFVRVNQPYEDLIDRNSQPRMPWHDVHCSISGPAVQDVAYHFIQRWNFVCSKNDYQLRTGWCICLRTRRFKLLPKCLVPMDFNGWTLRYPSSDTPVRDESKSIPLVREQSMDSMEPFMVVQSTPMYPRLDWISGGPCMALQPLRTPGTDGDQLADTEVLRAQRGESILQVFHPNAKVCNIQVVRSVSMWSAGVPTEASVQTAYIELIARAQHYLYIENQFFISGMDGNSTVGNRILQALADRIELAVQRNEVFRVYVVMPLLPAFEGNIRSQELTNLHAVMHWQFATICRGRHSLFAALKDVTDEPERYVSFFGLRKYGIMPNGCVSTEQIYIHSKLLIVDDQHVIIGSANINDRSMMGDRDSEIAVVIQDMQFEEGYMNDQPFKRGVSAGALRMQLFREHLGLGDDDWSVADPTSERTWQRIRNVSQNNTKIFESVFDCAPSNRMRAFASFQSIDVTQIYENQRINVLKAPGRRRHVWDKQHLKDGDYAPWTDVNGVPIAEDRINLDDFVVDSFKDKRKKHLFSMDHDGWLYARNFSVFQEIRTMKTDYRKREKLQHLVADRLMAQVRRRRWVKKGTMPALALMNRELHTRESSMSEVSDDDEHGRWHSLWRRLQQGDFSRANSISLNLHGSSVDNPMDCPSGAFHNSQPSSVIMMNDTPSYPNSPTVSSFRGPQSPLYHHSHGGRSSSAYGGGGGTRSRVASARDSYSHEFGHHHKGPGSLNQHAFWDSSDSRRSSVDGAGKGLGTSMKRWYSQMDVLDFGRRSMFKAEYFDKDEDGRSYYGGDDALLETGRGSVRSVRNSRAEVETELVANDKGDCQMSHVQTAATVPKEGESRARGQLSEIRGHLVEFPLDFLVEEILKPSIMPRDIYT